MVGGEGPGGHPRPVEQLVAVEWKPFPVAVDECGGAGAGRLHGCSDQSCDLRPHPVSADSDTGASREGSAGVVAPDDAGHPPISVAAQAGDRDPEPGLDSGVPGRVDQDRVEHGAARGVERIHARARLDRYVDEVLAVVEDAASHGRCARGRHPVQQSPAGQLQDTAAQQGVGRERVGAEAAAVDHEDPQAGPGEDHGGPRPGRPGPHDDDVVGGRGHTFTSMLTGTPLVRTSYTAERRRDRSTSPRSLSGSSPSSWKLIRICS